MRTDTVTLLMPRLLKLCGTKMLRAITQILLILLACLSSVSAMAAEYMLYYLGGQSNMDGYGYVSELPREWGGTVDSVMIFQGVQGEDGKAGGGEGIWAPLKPGHGTGFNTDGKTNTLSDRFGPELSFGKFIAELNPNKNIAIIKYSRGGTSLLEGASGYGNWEPDSELEGGINQYDHALMTFRNALLHRDIDQDGEVDTLTPAGIVWMQGEADAYDNPVAARAYRDNLKRMMDLFRAALHSDDLPVVIGRIIDSGRDEDGLLMDYSPIVQQAQIDYTAADRCATLVDIGDKLNWSDDWHYGTEDYLRLGKAFAKAAGNLATECLVDQDTIEKPKN
ncbi:MAG: sialate O-acetylesterase [Gammaproteobacteria bacterium]|nr:sialate O-acetylesterase [Gammaproteobacteria bacterium]NNK97742.1 hypothetical protein [Xanthomonadales bacterium]